ncbi:hypothetical protein P6165_15975 (plasmid) [Lactiplantibacillus plantarum]|uniref:hypothetical protein n=1 Tax=Lactiplantibacillus plantarum TaxID=1590 RepID=UPI002416917D|nr:hypothetical protein [Lactiplantibacillus plantarum]WFP21035.1 hypothetical protein P6165_15975 [Lactiplantibacillus plantarum]
MNFTTLFEDAGHKVKFIDKKKGKIKSSPLGISWTTFFFGVFAPLFRGDWLGAFGVLSVTSYVISPIATLVIQIAVAVFYNYIYISRLLAKGYELYDANDIELVKKHGYNVDSDANE